MNYAVKEIFSTLQGEGAHAGRPAVFVRFAGCNLWSGREADRSTAACRFCDTDFIGGKRLTAREIAAKAEQLFPSQRSRFVVFTGGEPALQLDKDLLYEFRNRSFFTAIETNGTVPLKANPDWITVSPKTRTLQVADGDELKLVMPQTDLNPADFEALPFHRFYVQPKWEWGWWRRRRNLSSAMALCCRRPQWRLSQQNHKRWGIA
jgi:7-carboxy-7-deazaguanine synthase (Cx14CxxC type)